MLRQCRLHYLNLRLRKYSLIEVIRNYSGEYMDENKKYTGNEQTSDEAKIIKDPRNFTKKEEEIIKKNAMNPNKSETIKTNNIPKELLTNVNSVNIIEDNGVVENKKTITNTHMQGFERTLVVFRDLESMYPFLKHVVPSPPDSGVSKIFWLKFASMTENKHDMLEAWHLFTWQEESPLHCQFLSQLKKALPDYSYSDLASITYNFISLQNRPDELASLENMVDSQLTVAMKQKLGGIPSKQEIEECLQVAFILLRGDLRSYGGQVRRIRGCHNWWMLSLLLTKHLSLLSPQHLVFCIALAGFHRQFPGCDQHKTGADGSPIQPRLNEALIHVLDELSSRELGIVCHALHKTGLHLETKHSEIRQALLRCLIDFPESSIAREEYTVACIAKFLKKRGAENRSHVIKVMSHYRPHLGNLSNYTKLRLLMFIVSGGTTSQQNKDFVSELCLSCSSSLTSMRLKDLEQLAYCIYFLNHQELKFNLGPLIAEAVQDCDWDNIGSGLSFVYLTSVLAKMEVGVETNMDSIIRAANECDMEDVASDSDEALAAAVQFIFKLNISSRRQISNESLYDFLQGHRARCKGALRQILDMECIREIDGLQGVTPLDINIKKKLIKVFHPFNENLKLSDFINESGKIISIDSNEQTKNFIQRDMTIILGGERFLWRGHAFPHSTKPDLFFCLDASGDPLPIAEDFQCYTYSGIRHCSSLCLEDGARLHVVVVPSRQQGMQVQGHQHGPVQHKLKHLARLGYVTHLVHWKHYYHSLKTKENLRFLRSLLNLKYTRSLTKETL